MFWHGSPNKREVLVPQASPLLAGKAVVFATPSRTAAAVFSRRWTNRDFDFGCVTEDGKSFLVLTEKRKGAFAEIFEGKEGHLHGVDHRRFEEDERPGMHNHEFVSFSSEPVLKTVSVPDVGHWLRNADSAFRIELLVATGVPSEAELHVALA